MLHLLCDTDLPWQPDSVRENGGEMRNTLNETYKKAFRFEGLNIIIRIVI